MQSCLGSKAVIPGKSRFDVVSKSSDDEDIWWEWNQSFIFLINNFGKKLKIYSNLCVNSI